MYLQLLISGLLTGGLYAIMASGFSLISGVMKLLNFTHGALIMVGAYVTFVSVTSLGISPFLAIPISMAFLFALGYCIQRYLLNLIMRAPTYMTLIFTFGLDMIIVTLVLRIFTGDIRSVIVPFSGESLIFFGASIPVIRLIVFIIAVIASALLYALINFTKFGHAITAARMDLDAARLMGVDIGRIYALTFATGTAMAGLAGSLLAMLGPISPTMGSLYSVKAFAICVLGGSGSMAGPLVGGIIMALLETFGVSVFGAGYQEAVSFIVLLIVLVVRPRGIFGKEF